MDNIKIEKFRHKHLSILVEMLKDQDFEDVDHINMKTLPKIGFVATMNDILIAAGFLRRVEKDLVAQIDTLMSNPYFGSMIRHQGLDLVVKTLISEAKQLKLHGIYAHTKDYSIIKRAQSVGFHVVEQSIIALPFKGD